jgi:hypothetical protein
MLLDCAPPVHGLRIGVLWLLEQMKTGDPSVCWEYPFGRDEHGYGRLNYNGKLDRSHRVAWRLHHGRELPDDFNMVVMHDVCDNPPCCNPHHLLLGHRVVNFRTARERGLWRPPQGEGHASAKLTDGQVREIRATDDDQGYLAELFGVSQGTISAIKTRRTWKHLD